MYFSLKLHIYAMVMYMQSMTREILHESLHVYSYMAVEFFLHVQWVGGQIDIITESLKTVPTLL